MYNRDGALGETSRSTAPAKSGRKQRDPKKNYIPTNLGVKIGCRFSIFHGDISSDIESLTYK